MRKGHQGAGSVVSFEYGRIFVMIMINLRRHFK